jgi:hypothetical protein
MPDEIGAVGARPCTLGDAVETLIRAARRGTLMAMMRRVAEQSLPARASARGGEAWVNLHGGVRLEIARPEYGAIIRAATEEGVAAAIFAIPRRSIMAGEERRFRSFQVGDRKVTEAVSHRTFEALGEILGPVE